MCTRSSFLDNFLSIQWVQISNELLMKTLSFLWHILCKMSADNISSRDLIQTKHTDTYDLKSVHDGTMNCQQLSWIPSDILLSHYIRYNYNKAVVKSYWTRSLQTAEWSGGKGVDIHKFLFYFTNIFQHQLKFITMDLNMSTKISRENTSIWTLNFHLSNTHVQLCGRTFCRFPCQTSQLCQLECQAYEVFGYLVSMHDKMSKFSSYYKIENNYIKSG